MKILIIRHGDPNYELDSLTPQGFVEADLLAQRLSGMQIDDFYCSPYGRAKATAAPTLERFGKTAEILPWLREFDGKIQSPFTGKSRIAWDLPPSIWCMDKAYFDVTDWHHAGLLADGDSGACFAEVTAGVDALLARYGWQRQCWAYRGGEDKTIALFCHFGLGASVLAYLIGMSPAVAQNNLFLAPSSVTTLVSQTDAAGWSHFRAVGIGDISHLYAAGRPASQSGLYPHFEK